MENGEISYYHLHTGNKMLVLNNGCIIPIIITHFYGTHLNLIVIATEQHRIYAMLVPIMQYHTLYVLVDITFTAGLLSHIFSCILNIK